MVEAIAEAQTHKEGFYDGLCVSAVGEPEL
jgi:hypothetical protein